MDLNINLTALLEDARRREQDALDDLPLLVQHGALSQAEADGVRQLCQESIDEINRQMNKLP